MREDDPLWWTIGTWKTTGRILMCYGADLFEACVLLGVEPCEVHQCSTPYLLKACSERGGGKTWEQPVESLPSVYDQFTRPGFRGWDYQAMRDAGYEVD